MPFDKLTNSPHPSPAPLGTNAPPSIAPAPASVEDPEKALFEAIYKNDSSAAVQLIQKIRDPKTLRSALVAASVKGHLDFIVPLLNAGAPINVMGTPESVFYKALVNNYPLSSLNPFLSYITSRQISFSFSSRHGVNQETFLEFAQRTGNAPLAVWLRMAEPMKITPYPQLMIALPSYPVLGFTPFNWVPPLSYKPPESQSAHEPPSSAPAVERMPPEIIDLDSWADLITDAGTASTIPEPSLFNLPPIDELDDDQIEIVSPPPPNVPNTSATGSRSLYRNPIDALFDEIETVSLPPPPIPNTSATATLTSEEQKRLDADLWAACTGGFVHAARNALNRGANINATDPDGNHLLHYAAGHGQKDIIQLLIEHEREKGLILNINVKGGKLLATPLHGACGYHQLDTVKLLLQNGALINVTDKDGLHPLHYAAVSGFTDIVQLLIDHAHEQGLDLAINAKGGPRQFTPLHTASWNGQTDTVKTLLAAGASTQLRNAEGKTPLALAKTVEIRGLIFAHNQRAASTTTAPTATSVQPPARTPVEQKRLDDGLLKACGEGSVNVVKNYLNRGANIHATNNNSWQPLHFAVGHIDIVQLLIDHAREKGLTLDINAKGGPYYQRTPLHDACASGLADTIQLLLAAGASTEIRDIAGKTPLDLATTDEIKSLIIAHNQRVASTSVLTAASSQPPSRTPEEQKRLDDGLREACQRGSVEDVRNYLNRGAKINTINTPSWLPLHHAASRGHKGIVQLLIDHARDNGLALDINAKGEWNQVTPLHEACTGGHLDTVKILLVNGADINATNKYGLQPLHIAASEGYQDILQLLIDHARDNGLTFDINGKGGSHQYKPLHWACQNGHLEAVKVLLENGASTEVRDANGKTPLDRAQTNEIKRLIDPHNQKASGLPPSHTPKEQMRLDKRLLKACKRGSVKDVRHYLNRGANINASDNYGLSPLHYVASYGKPDIVQLLINHAHEKDITLDINAIVGVSKRSPVHWACENGFLDTVKILLENGASTEIRDSEGKTPLDLAKTDEIKQLIIAHNQSTSSTSAPAAASSQPASRTPEEQKQLDDGLLDACMNGLADGARDYLNRGADINATNKDGWQTLHYAWVNIVQLLIDHARKKGFALDINAKGGSTQRTPLHNACARGLADSVKLLLAAGASTEVRDVKGNSPLDVAKTDEIKKLINEHNQRAASTTAPSQPPSHAPEEQKQLDNGLLEACASGSVESARNYLNCGANLNATSNDNGHPLDYAAGHGHKDIVQLLIDHAREKGLALDLNAKGGPFHTPPLHAACGRGHANTAKILLENGANINATDQFGRHALHHAVIYGHKDIVQLLIDHAHKKGLELDINTKGGQSETTPLHLACYKGSKDTVKLLLAAAASTEVRNAEGKTPLDDAKTDEIKQLIIAHNQRVASTTAPAAPPTQTPARTPEEQKQLDGRFLHACKNGTVDGARFYLNRGANINATDKDGMQPLHHAAANGHKNILQLLIDYASEKNLPFDINAKVGSLQMTPLHDACQNGSLDIVKLLLAAGASTEIRDSKGKTPLDLAKTDEIKKLIIAHNQRVASTSAPAAASGQSPSLTPVEQKRLDDVLRQACQRGSVEDVRFYLNLGANIHATNNKGWQPLHLAAFYNHKDIVQLLINHAREKGLTLDINVKGGPLQMTPLHDACQNGSLDIVKLLLAAGASTKVLNVYGKTPLDIAKTDEIKQLIIAHNQRASSTTAPSQTPTLTPEEQKQLDDGLLQACLNGNVDGARDYLNRGADINATHIEGGQALHFAASYGHKDIVQLLIDHAREKGLVLDINAKAGSQQTTPLHVACTKGHLDAVKILLENGANFNATTKDGWHPLLYAASGHKDIVQFLITYAREKGLALDINAKSGPSQLTPLHSACYYGHADTVKLLLDNGADINATNKYGMQSLHLAAANGQKDIVQFLITYAREKGFALDINAKGGAEQVTPLHAACFKSQLDTVKLLLAAGASTEIRDAKGRTPLDDARTDEIKALIRQHQNNPTPPSNREPSKHELERAGKQLLGKIAEHYSSRFHAEFVSMLVKNKGQWGIDFSRLPSKKIDKKEWIAPFVAFLEAHPGSKAAEGVVKQHLEFFRFSDSSNIQSIPFGLTDALIFIENVLNANTLLPRVEDAPLSKYFASEACQTLFSLKLRELDYMVHHPERYFPPVERELQQRPCFIQVKDYNKVHVHIMLAHFGTMGFVDSFGADEENEALRFLFVDILNQPEIPFERIQENGSVILSWDEYTLLDSYLATMPSSSIPNVLVPMREKPSLVNEPSDGEDIDDEEEISSDEPIRDRNPPKRREGEQEKRPRTNTPAEQPHPSNFRSFFDLLPERLKKRSHREREIAAPHSKRLRKNAFDEPSFRGAFVPLDQQRSSFGSNGSKRQRSGGTDGEIPEINPPARMRSLADDGVFSDNPYEILNRESVKKIRNAVSREVARESVVLQEIKPLPYPINEKLDALPKPESIVPWTRTLKPYQTEALQEVMRFNSHGLSKLLSLEMGLGKTFVYGEFLIQSIAKSLLPQLHVVAAPLSVIGQIQKDLANLVLEASITAWQISGKSSQSRPRASLYKELFDSAKNPEALKSVLRVLPYFPNRFVSILEYDRFIKTPHLQDQLQVLLREHLEEVRSLLKDSPVEEAQFDDALADINPCFTFEDAIFGSFEEPKQGRELYELCILAGRILDLHPLRMPLPDPLPTCSEQELASLRNLGLSKSEIVKENFINSRDQKQFQKDLTKLPEAPQKPKICICDLNSLHKNLDKFPEKHVGSLVVDEANRAQNDKKTKKNASQQQSKSISQKLRETISKFRERCFENTDSNNILFVTGTPFENQLQELWTLLDLANLDELLPRLTCDALMKETLGTTIRQLTNLVGDFSKRKKKIDKDAIGEFVLISFAQFMAFRDLVQKLVHRKNKEDPQVIANWHGRIPTKTAREIRYNFDYYDQEDLREELNFVEKGIHGFTERAYHTQILIHPSLADKSLADEEKAGFPFLDPFRNGDEDEKWAWFQESPYLNAVLTDNVFLSAMQANQKRVIFCDRNALSQAFKEVLEHFYPNAKVYQYNGSQKGPERDAIIDQFKKEDASHPSAFVTMIKVGGVGLNLADAHGAHICATQWNEGQKRQAEARLIRSGSTGEKDIPEIDFEDTYFSAHPKVIREKKRNWENFLWNPSEKPKELFRAWAAVLGAETLQNFLNAAKDEDRRDIEGAMEQNKTITQFLDKLIESMPDERLENAIAKASSNRSAPSSPSTTAAPSVPRPAGFGNASNNCWCNALLQMVVSVPSLRRSYETFARHYSSGAASSSSNDEQHRQSLLDALESYDAATAAGVPLPASVSQGVREALHILSKGAISASPDISEDASEALNWILGGYKELVEKGLVNEPIDPLFTPMVTSRVYQPEGPTYRADPMKVINTRRGGDAYTPVPANNTSSQTQLWPEIRIPLQGTDDLNFNTLLERFFRLPGSDETAQYLTPSNALQKFRLVETRNQFQTAPAEFLLNLERFGKLQDATPYKIDSPVHVPLTLTLPANAVAEPLPSPAVYTLDSFIVHTGSTEAGHYIAYKKVGQTWFECNDSSVRQVAQADIEAILNGGQTTYVHHYTRA